MTWRVYCREPCEKIQIKSKIPVSNSGGNRLRLNFDLLKLSSIELYSLFSKSNSSDFICILCEFDLLNPSILFVSPQSRNFSSRNRLSMLPIELVLPKQCIQPDQSTHLAEVSEEIICPVCGKRFNKHVELAAHMRTHPGH
ncbi:uncharacterized protein VTP21DRAFT_4094 [Calcarisporiella thermophila]|uniref:uncharacterized protein n=1 Tax=Calcarisporiella thermophila TaxID=911321 RepID=UPI0037428C64